MNDLVDIPESLSPRMQSLRTNRCQTRLESLPRGRIGPFDTKPWSCCNYGQTVCGFGDDEIEATMAYARIIGVEHWLETELRSQRITILEDEAPIILEDEIMLTKADIKKAIADVEGKTGNPHLIHGNNLHVVIETAKHARYRIAAGKERVSRGDDDYVLDERAT